MLTYSDGTMIRPKEVVIFSHGYDGRRLSYFVAIRGKRPDAGRLLDYYAHKLGNYFVHQEIEIIGWLNRLPKDWQGIHKIPDYVPDDFKIDEMMEDFESAYRADWVAKPKRKD